MNSWAQSLGDKGLGPFCIFVKAIVVEIRVFLLVAVSFYR